MKTTPFNLPLLNSPLFILCVFLLLLNDFVLKYSFPGVITGKLSDFAGIAAFTLFWLAFFPDKKIQIQIAIVLFFIFWKTELCSPLLFWLQENGIRLHRTPDLTDFLALAVLPACVRYAKNYPPGNSRTWLTLASTSIAFFSFSATSYYRPQPIMPPVPYYSGMAVPVDSAVSKIQLVTKENGLSAIMENQHIPVRFEIIQDDSGDYVGIIPRKWLLTLDTSAGMTWIRTYAQYEPIQFPYSLQQEIHEQILSGQPSPPAGYSHPEGMFNFTDEWGRKQGVWMLQADTFNATLTYRDNQMHGPFREVTPQGYFISGHFEAGKRAGDWIFCQPSFRKPEKYDVLMQFNVIDDTTYLWKSTYRLKRKKITGYLP